MPSRKLPVLDALPVEPPDLRRVLDALPVTESHLDDVLDALPVEPQPRKRQFPPARRGLLGTLLHFIWRVVWGLFRAVEWCFGVGVLLIGLAVLAALPVLQFLSLGYLLEAGGRVARSGRLRDGFIGVRLAARLGFVVAALYLFLLPVGLAAGLARDAQIIDPDGPVARGWRIGLLVVILAIAVPFVGCCALFYNRARDLTWDTLLALRLPYYFWLGLRGFVGAFAWLVLPISLLALGRAHFPFAPLLGFLGALQLAVVLLYLPFLQMHLAETNKLSAVFDFWTVRERYRRAPWLFAVAFLVTLASAVPLYLLKIEVVPRETTWLPGLFFIGFIFPARLLTGWALARGKAREKPRHWFFRWTTRIPLLPIAAFYVLIVFFTQYTSWNGVWSLYEQHAFLVPVPFFGG